VDTRPEDAPQAEATRLRELIAACLERIDEGGEAALEAFLAQHEDDAAVLRDRLAALGAFGMLPNSRGDGEAFPDRLGDFRLLRRLGGGGMGVVYAAVQESLQREVAIKMIRPEHLYFQGARERFRREVESVARLQHPGIVPVYVVGESCGLPFFAMELVRGKTLAEVIGSVQGTAAAQLSASALRRAVGESGSGERLELGHSWVEVVLRVCVQVADALAHAHERGVLHRDVKPSNVMVTASGRALLLDFGLAAIEGGQHLTRTGHNVGSLPYMAPEQVLAQSGEVGPWTDVYALGVLLFELLTLRSPFLADTAEGTRARVLAGETSSLHALNPAIPWDVETICLKAMRRDRRQRYQGAVEMADDLRRFLDLRPIVATRPGAADRLRTWIRRHPIKTVLSVAGAVVLVAGPAAVAVQQRLARSQIQAALAQAEVDFQRALRAVDELLKEVGSKDLRDVPQMDQVRARLLERATAHYEAFLSDRPRDLDLRRKAALAASALGDAWTRLGRTDEAEKMHRRAIALATDAVAASPGEFGAQRLLAMSHHSLGYLLLTRGDSAGAQVELEEAVARYRVLCKLEATDVELAGVMADAMNSLGASLTRLGRLDAAQAMSEQARDVLAALVGGAPERVEFQTKLAATWQSLGRLHHIGGRLELARDAHEHALELYQALPEARRSERGARFAEAVTHRYLGDVLGDLGAWEQAEAEFLRSLELRSALMNDHPQVPDYRRDLAIMCSDFAERLLDHGSLEDAESRVQQAVTLLEALVTQFGTHADYRSHLGHAWMVQGRVLLARGQRERAVEALAVARRRQEEAIERAPHDPSYRIRLANAVGTLGESLQAAGDHAGAARALTEAAAVADEVMGRVPVPAGTKRIFARRRGLLADALLAAGDLDRAAEVADVLAGGEREQRLAAAGVFARLAGLGREPPSEAAAAKALELLRQLLTESRDGIDRQAPQFAALRARPEFAALFQ